MSVPSSSSSEVMTPGRSRPGMGGRTFTEPVAAKMRSAVYAVRVPSAPVTLTWPGAVICAVPSSTSTFALFSRERMPPRSFSLTLRLKANISPMS